MIGSATNEGGGFQGCNRNPPKHPLSNAGGKAFLLSELRIKTASRL